MLKINVKSETFPSPVGDYVSSLEEEFAVKDEYKAVSVPCRGLCFFTWDDITINQKVADFCFRPLSGIMFLHNYKKFTLEGGEVGFRPLSGIMFLHFCCPKSRRRLHFVRSFRPLSVIMFLH